ncbi:hypothetical protein ACJJTC_001669 [Scirpophaga incertulas]
MSGHKLEVIWCPVHHDKFILRGSDITLYQVSRLKDIEKKTPYTQISPTRGATVIASQSANNVRCIDVSAIPDLPEPLLALGHSNGRVSLATLKQAYDPLGLVGRDFNTRYPRLCNSLSWSNNESNLLAVAMEKYRSEPCILLWDVNRGTLPPEESTSADSSLVNVDTVKPLAEMGLSETAHSVSWSNWSNRTLLASMNLKHIKIFDLRDWSNKGVVTASGRHVYGVCADPFSGRNLLLSLQRDSNTLRLFDIQQAHNDPNKANVLMDNMAEEAQTATAVEAELAELSRAGGAAGAGGEREAAAPSVLERELAAGGAALAAACWHPAHPARLLAAAHNGAVCELTVCERVTVSWGGGALAWSCGGSLRVLPRARARGAPTTAAGAPPGPDHDDVSHVMRRRAVTDYGLKPDLWQNADLADDEVLSGLWHFLALSKSLVEDGGGGCAQVLGRAREPRVRAAALALAGLAGLGGGGGGAEPLWRDALRLAAPALPDAYLRATLHFLAALHDAQPQPAALSAASLSAALMERDMRLEDRVALACLYLPDDDLREYLTATCAELVERGDLSGILLTGMGAEGVRLLQRWVERSGDVQTAALAAARCLPPELLRAPPAAHWLQEYRALLDGWRLWGARSALDTWVGLGVGVGGAGGVGGEDGEWCARGVSVSCAYCGKPVAAPPAHRRRPRLPPPAAKMKQMSSCPNCRKPLPRCGVCSLHLGGGGARFGGWFSWCVSCRHGGHADHLLHWFQEHTECPVSSCTCHCGSLDPPDRL